MARATGWRAGVVRAAVVVDGMVWEDGIVGSEQRSAINGGRIRGLVVFPIHRQQP